MQGPCAKRRVICTIETLDGAIFDGENDCMNAQLICPRAPGEDYAKCASICRQSQHAELSAIAAALAAGADLDGSTATLTGHHYICEPCGIALRDAGVATLTIDFA